MADTEEVILVYEIDIQVLQPPCFQSTPIHQQAKGLTPMEIQANRDFRTANQGVNADDSRSDCSRDVERWSNRVTVLLVGSDVLEGQ